MLLPLIVFLLVLGILVFVHELGHFMVAKWVGMRVDEFAIGFPPRLFAKKLGDTTYAINALPLGGYVKIHGEGSKADDHDPRSFQSRSVIARIAVIVAGVTMNILFALLLMSVAFSIGFPASGLGIENIPGAVIQKSQVMVANVLPDSPAKNAHISSGDVITQFTDSKGKIEKITSIDGLIDYTHQKQYQGDLNLAVSLDNGTATRTEKIALSPTGPALGAGIQDLTQIRVPVWRSPEAAGKAVYYIASSTWNALGGFAAQLFEHGTLDPTVSGPVGIYKVTSAATHQGLAAIVFLTVALSVNLALLNILPIPALDGGKLVFLVIELVFRKRMVSEKIENAVSAGGFVVLLLLIAVITLHDIGVF